MEGRTSAVPALLISIPRGCPATNKKLRLDLVPTPYPLPNSTEMNTYEEKGGGGWGPMFGQRLSSSSV
ncbi:MAG: hypothetical protein NVS9B14_07110 [Candidatus Acidiferrum sp.]